MVGCARMHFRDIWIGESIKDKGQQSAGKILATVLLTGGAVSKSELLQQVKVIPENLTKN